MATLGGNRHRGASREGEKALLFLEQGGWGKEQLLVGTAHGYPLGFLPLSQSFGCGNNPSFSPLCISPEVQQSSFYGYTGLLPKRYTQGVMTGESKYLQPLTMSTSHHIDLHLLLGPK